MNKALREWIDSKRGNMQKLADAIYLSQPAISQWVNPDKHRSIRIEYAERIMRATGLMAKDIYSDHYKLFSSVDYKDGIISSHDEAYAKTKAIRERLDVIEKLHIEINELLSDL